jgi:hypothetical protein
VPVAAASAALCAQNSCGPQPHNARTMSAFAM